MASPAKSHSPYNDPIQAAPAAKKPQLVCIGTPSITEAGRVSQSGMYYVQPIDIAGLGISPGTRFYLLYRPEWLRPGFDPGTIEDEKVLSVYRRHINSVGKVSALKGLSGSEENFRELASALLALEDPGPEEVARALDEFFRTKRPVVGYVLRQRYDAFENESGERRYIATEFYQVGSWFFPTEEALARLRRAAEDPRKNIEYLVDTEVPF